MTVPTILRAGPSDTERVAEVIGAAFMHLGVSEWLVPEPELRSRILPRNFEILVEHAVEHGTVEVAGDWDGAAVWFVRDRPDVPAPVEYDKRVAEVCGEWTDRFRHLDELFERHHPPAAHHHLAFLAVRTERRGGGIGSALLDSYHRRLDRAGVAAFLEASSTRARALYLRHGYQDLGAPYGVPNGALFYPMWREPRATR